MEINKLTSLATAESCTGGEIARKIVSKSGASAYFKGGVVSYSNEAKENVLGVDAALLKKHGAVSKEVVLAMALGASKVFKSDYAVSTSGIAGPSGGTLKKPVGLVWIGVKTPKKLTAKKFIFKGTRAQIIKQAANTALKLLEELS
jgi:competence/damage-inducible protein CinA C-terminal domain